MKQWQIGLTVLVTGFLSIILSGVFESEVMIPQRFSIGLGGIGLVVGGIIMYVGYLLKIDMEELSDKEEEAK